MLFTPISVGHLLFFFSFFFLLLFFLSLLRCAPVRQSEREKEDTNYKSIRKGTDFGIFSFLFPFSFPLQHSYRTCLPLGFLSQMKTIMSKNNLQDLPSKRQFHWTTKVSHEDEVISSSTHKSSSFKAAAEDQGPGHKSKVPFSEEVKIGDDDEQMPQSAAASANATRKKLQAIAVSRWRSVITAFGKHRAHYFQHSLGSRVVGTLFGYRKGHVHFAFQKDPNSQPVFLIELATPITGLVHEMASGLVRIALECDKEEKKPTRLLEEPLWRTNCNGKKCGFATRRECGPKEWNVLKAVEPISMGAGVLPGNGDGAEPDGEIMYMRAKFERVVGSRDSEAFYMMNPDSNGAPELSIYLLRV